MTRSSWIAVGAVCAASVVAYGGPDVSAAVPVVGAALSVSAITLVRARRIGAAAATLTALAVVVRVLAASAIAPTTTESAVLDAAGREHEAIVLSLTAPSGGQQRAVVELRAPETANRIWASLPRYPEIAPGDVIRFGGALEAAPEDDGFGAFLARSGIAYTVRVREFARVGDDGSPVAQLEQLRRAAADAITRTLPEPEAGLASAMSIGLRDLVARDVAADFRTTGLSHVVAISGWHIAMLGGVVSGLLGGIARRPRTAVVLAAIVAYAVFAGASPSILRAAVMATVVLVARESGRRGSAAAGLSLTVAGMILVDPQTISDIGFQLSAAATAGLLVWGSRSSAWLESRLPKRTPKWFIESLGVSMAAQAATLPLVLFHFGTLSVVSPLANLLIGPFVAPSMLVTGVAFVSGILVGAGVPMLLFAPLALVGGLVVGAMIAIAHVCAALPFATVVLVPPLNIALALASILALAWTLRRRGVPNAARVLEAVAVGKPAAQARSPRFAAAGAAATACLLVFAAVGARPDGRLHMTVLDVGQGDSILLQGPRGGRALIDTGPDPDRLVALLDARIPAWDRRLDLVVLTHPHEDHVAGLAKILDRYRVSEIVEPGMVGPGPGDAAYRRRMTELGRQSRVVAAGDTLTLDGIRMDVDWPLPGTVPLRPPDTGTAINNVSIVLDVHYGDRRLVLAGDVEQQIDPQLLAEGIARDGQPLDVLKVAHHGSGTATTDAFLDQMKPRVAVVSAGWGNPYGHPSPRTVQRLVDSGARVFRTDIDGSVDVSTDGRDLISTPSGGRARPTSPTPSRPPGIGFCPIPPAITRAGRVGRRTYNRADGDPDTDRRRAHPSRAPSARLAARALGDGRGRRQLPRAPDRGARTRDKRAAR